MRSSNRLGNQRPYSEYFETGTKDESGDGALITLLYCKIQKVKSEAVRPKTASTYSKLEQ